LAGFDNRLSGVVGSRLDASELDQVRQRKEHAQQGLLWRDERLIPRGPLKEFGGSQLRCRET
jgi:hypothetical protein